MTITNYYLLSADFEGEGLAPVSGAVHLLAIGEGEYVVADHCLASPANNFLQKMAAPATFIGSSHGIRL
jgi:hypothetical protein